MDINAVTTLIQSLGFPIVCCGALFWKMNKQDEQHKNEVDKITDAVSQMTIAITQLTDYIKENK